MNEPSLLREMLGLKTIAVVGLSDRPDRPSFYVSEYMQQHGFTILPVNPALQTVLGQPAFPTLAALPVKPEVVNVFRNASFLPAVVDEMIALGLTHLWTQKGIVDLPTAARAEAAGIRVVMDHCLMVEHRRL